MVSPLSAGTQRNDALLVNDEFVLGKCDYFVEVQLWPLAQRLNPRRWLSNFQSNEMAHALHLLNAFMYFPQYLMDQMLISAVQGLSRFFRGPNDSFLSAQLKWRQFFDRALISCVRGETPNATDSGFRFLRMARQTLGIPESRIMEPEKVLQLIAGKNPAPVLFLDDFVGSGQQFITTWRREIAISDGEKLSFESLASLRRDVHFLYCPLVCTEKGAAAIAKECPVVKLHPAHILSGKYSAFHLQSTIWPGSLRPQSEEFIKTTSARAGIVNWKGFHSLGLTLAFEHSVPDATLPLFYWNQNGWKPLIDRT